MQINKDVPLNLLASAAANPGDMPTWWKGTQAQWQTMVGLVNAMWLPTSFGSSQNLNPYTAGQFLTAVNMFLAAYPPSGSGPGDASPSGSGVGPSQQLWTDIINSGPPSVASLAAQYAKGDNTDQNAAINSLMSSSSYNTISSELHAWWGKNNDPGATGCTKYIPNVSTETKYEISSFAQHLINGTWAQVQADILALMAEPDVQNPTDEYLQALNTLLTTPLQETTPAAPSLAEIAKSDPTTFTNYMRSLSSSVLQSLYREGANIGKYEGS